MTQSKKSSISKISAKLAPAPVKAARRKSASDKSLPVKESKTELLATPMNKPAALVTKIQSAPAKKPAPAPEEETFAREYWTGDSRDGVLVNGDGYHYYRMTKAGRILEAYEYYESEDGREFASPLPEMLNVHWLEDLGFEDFDALDAIKEFDFQRIKEICSGVSPD